MRPHSHLHDLLRHVAVESFVPTSPREAVFGLLSVLLAFTSLADLLLSSPYKTAAALILLTSVCLATVSGRLVSGLLAAALSIYMYDRWFRADTHPHGSVVIFTFFLAIALALSQMVVRVRHMKTQAMRELQRKQIELAQIASAALGERESLELALGAGKMSAWEWTPEHGYTWSRGFWPSLGYRDGQFDGPIETMLEVAHPDDREALRRTREAVLQHENDAAMSYRIFDSNGNIRWVEGHWRSYADEEGKVVRALAVVADITERHLADQERALLLEREQQARSAAEQAQAHLMFLAQASERLSESLDLEQTLASIVKVAIPTLADWFIIDLLDEKGQFKRLAVVHGNPEKAEFARRLVAFPPEISASEGSGRVATSGASIIYDPVSDDVLDNVATTPEHRELLERLGVGAAIQVGLTARGHTFGVLAAVSETPGRYSKSDQQLFEGVAMRIALAIDNARLYGEVQRALAEHSQLLAELNANLSGAPVGMAFFDTDLRYVRINDFLADATHTTIEEHFGRRPTEVIGERWGGPIERLLRRVLETGAPLVEYAITEAMTGVERHWRISIYPVYGPAGNLYGLGVFAADVSDQTLLEQQLLQAQKLEAVGLLAGGIAHDFNNVLTAISVSGDLLERNLPEDSLLRREAGEIQRAAQRASQLTKQLLAFSKRQVLQPQPLALNEIILETQTLLRRLLSEQIDLVVSLEDGLAATIADPSQIEQVIINLSVNARDAMPEGGTLTLATSTLSLEHPEAGALNEIPAGKYVCLEVSDTGSGIEQQLVHQIFDPFFTTKEPGEGTGLGLATVYGIVTQSRGFIDVFTEEGRGSTFRVLLPASDTDARPSPLADASEVTAAEGETILFVEDEEAVRMLVGSLLEQLGYRVIEAGNGVEALERAAEIDQIHLLLTDLVMPKMGGRELAEELRVRVPDLRVLFISGHDDDPRLTEALSLPSTSFIEKPFTASHLARVLRQLIDDQQ